MKKICIVTSTRADYGIMSQLIDTFIADSFFETKLCVTGTHLSENYGFTKKYINVSEKFIDDIDIICDSDDQFEVYSNVVTKFTKYFCENYFDLVILLGDRFEIFAIASVAYMKKIQIAHIHGGEVSYGALDDGFRHCITKLSNLHFPSCEKYRNRIIQMGENPKNVINCGSLSVENISKMSFQNKDDLRNKYGFDLNKYAMITFNPVTRQIDNGVGEIKELFAALNLFDYELIILYPNIDSGNTDLMRIINGLDVDDVHIVKSLPYYDYLSLAKNSDLFIGNSSSGIIEIPSLSVPIINIGDRQKGRETSSSVIHCRAKREEIVNAINYINSKEYLDVLDSSNNIYYKKDSIKIIITEVKRYLKENNSEKYFNDLK